MVMQLQTRNNALECEVAALQSQITALKEKNDRNECLVEQLQEYSDDWDTLKEVVNGASLHPETGVSLVDDVRDLVKEREDLINKAVAAQGAICRLTAEVSVYKSHNSYVVGEWKKEEVLWKEREADMLSQISGYKAQVEQQAYYIKCLVEEVRSLKNDKEV